MDKFLDRRAAAEYLAARGVRTTAQSLATLASKGRGPAYSIINAKALYTASGLDAWVTAQASRDAREHRHSTATA